MAITTCQGLLPMFNDDGGIPNCGKPLDPAVITMAFHPLTGNRVEMLLCPDCRTRYIAAMAPFLNNCEKRDWLQHQPTLGSDGRLYDSTAVRAILREEGHDVPERGALRAELAAYFENMSALELRRALLRNPELLRKVLHTARTQDL
jgi:hypothetical protein